MDKQNYQKELDAILSSITKAKTFQKGKKPSLLLHACCAPCSSYVLEYLLNFFKITVFYYNPNIHPEAEYNRRLTELKNFLLLFSSEKIQLIEEPYNTQDFFDATNVQNEPELKTEAETSSAHSQKSFAISGSLAKHTILSLLISQFFLCFAPNPNSFILFKFVLKVAWYNHFSIASPTYKKLNIPNIF